VAYIVPIIEVTQPPHPPEPYRPCEGSGERLTFMSIYVGGNAVTQAHNIAHRQHRFAGKRSIFRAQRRLRVLPYHGPAKTAFRKVKPFRWHGAPRSRRAPVVPHPKLCLREATLDVCAVDIVFEPDGTAIPEQ